MCDRLAVQTEAADETDLGPPERDAQAARGTVTIAVGPIRIQIDKL